MLGILEVQRGPTEGVKWKHLENWEKKEIKEKNNKIMYE